MRHENILGVIGDTPLVGVHALSPNPDVRIFAKLEGQNPGGSSKDRIALKMIELAEEAGELRAGDTILEPSSGNTGIGLAMVARLRGYRLRVVMPENVSVERRQLLEIFGAEIVLSPADEGSNGAIRLSEKLGADDPSLVRLFQYGNPANPLAHYERTGPEIWRDCPEVDVFVAGLGTSGTLMGVGRYLKEQKPAVQIVAVEPPAGELVQGLRNLDDGFVPPIFDPAILDRKFIVRPARVDRVAAAPARRLRRVRRASRRARRSRARRRWPRRWSRARSSRCCPTRGGSTSRRARGPTTSTRSSSAPPASTTGSEPGRRGRDRARGRRAARRRPGGVPDRDRLRPRRRRVVARRGAAAVRGEGPAGRPSRDRAPRRRRAARRLGGRRRRHRAHADGARAGPARSPSWCAARRHVPDAVTGGLDTVGLRVPDQPVALALLRAFGGGVAAPSANRFGRVSPTTAADVLADLGDDVDVILDGGPCRVGVESTIVDCSGAEPAILRLGGIAARTGRGAARSRRCPLLDAGRGARPGHAGVALRAPGRGRARRRRRRSHAHRSTPHARSASASA